MKKLPNQCLGMIDGKRCETKLPLGRHVCDSCQRRNVSKKGIKTIYRNEKGGRVIKKDPGMI